MSVLVLMLERLFNGLAASVPGILPHDPTTYVLAAATIVVWGAHFALRRELDREVARTQERENNPR